MAHRYRQMLRRLRHSSDVLYVDEATSLLQYEDVKTFAAAQKSVTTSIEVLHDFETELRQHTHTFFAKKKAGVSDQKKALSAYNGPREVKVLVHLPLSTLKKYLPPRSSMWRGSDVQFLAAGLL